ncbi:FecR family protein [Negadavirga shengliensis]|uniref:FecR family protein n=1 Tax=Negadavirga shengliensis TaxID=1389218 RepID=A0ABV9SZ17_9BACT
MDIYSNSVRDLVLNPEFRKWVLHPNPESDKIWQSYLAKNPTAIQDVELAKELLLELFSNQYPLQESEFGEIWDYIDTETEKEDKRAQQQKIIPINRLSDAKRGNSGSSDVARMMWRVAAILVVTLGVGFLASRMAPTEPVAEQPVPAKFKEYTTPPGVKSSITLGDGTKVLLNSGSSLRYQENFSPERREVFLEGEAFFEVQHDPGRPFTVKTGEVSTTALGTSFNIMAYREEHLLISLVTGKVAIGVPHENRDEIILEPRQSLKIQPGEGDFLKVRFDEDQVMGWTRKMIVFNNTELSEAIRALENWYGVKFHFQNRPRPGMNLSGKFYNETLENVLEGLRYTAGLDFEIKKDKVSITFKHTP